MRGAVLCIGDPKGDPNVESYPCDMVARDFKKVAVAGNTFRPGGGYLRNLKP